MKLDSTWFPYFRAGRWPQMRSLVPNGDVTEQHLDEMAANGNRIIREKLLTPPIGLDHEPKSGDAAGWIERFQRVGRVLYFLPKWTSLGLDKLKGDAPLRRHLSAEIRKDFNTTGADDGAIIQGLCPVGAALLGRDLPAQKGLADLAGAVAFAETDDIVIFRDAVEVIGASAVYFAEIAEQTIEPPTEEKPTVKTAEQLQKELDDEKALREKAEKERDAALAKEADAKRDADLSEFRAKAETRVAKLVAEKKLGANAAKKAQAFLVSLHSADTDVATFAEKQNVSALEKEFSEFLDLLLPIDANFVEIDRKKDGDTAGLTVANFSEAATSTAVAQKIDRAVTERQKTNPKFTSADLLAELRSKSAS